MKKTLHRYNICQGSLETPTIEYKAEKLDSKDADILKDEIVKLQTKQLYLLGKNLTGLSLIELQLLEQQLSERMPYRNCPFREQLLMEQLEQSRVQEQWAMLENVTLHRQVEELRGFLPSTNRSGPSYLEYCPIERKNCVTSNGVASSDVTCSYTVEGGNSDNTLHLGTQKKTHSNDSETQLQLL
ncbi:hypothetical protein SLA2020_176790 [Shorea laevis]